MAEAIISLAVERIADLLIHEAAFLHGVSDEVERLQVELKRMQCFLKDADLKQQQDERVRNWVAEIRDVAYDAEDVIETFIVKVACREEDGLTGLLKKSVCILTKARTRHVLGTRIDSIQSKLKNISDSLQRYGIKFIGEGEGTSSASEMLQRLRRSYPHAYAEEVVSLKKSTRELMAQLMEDEDRLRIVSIVGMGGLGKTTLAKKAYNHINVKRHFDCCAWTFLSQQYVPRDVLYGILTKVISPSKEEREMLDKLKEDELVVRLYDVLKEKRYLVVLDDIWRNEAWDSLKVAFPCGKKGSKVLFTTRNKEVGLYADPLSSPIEPPFLTNEESWELLCMKAFPRDIGCRPEFEKLGREMVIKCGGLPLAIVVLGGLLVTKKSLSEWEMVQRDINAHLKKFQQQHPYGGVSPILALSYHDLPYHLKPCFLHLANFPEDWEIPKKKLIRLWIAEGFVPSALEGDGAETIEDVAEEYLGELISRCMVQVGRMDYTGRGVKTCHIHDLMRDLCILKAKEENFLRIVQDQGSTTATSRRVAIHSLMYPGDRYAPFFQGNPNIRSLSYLNKQGDENDLSTRQVIYICKEFRQLRVLDLSSIRFYYKSKVPREIRLLIHLRYLCLKFLWKIPSSIGNLRSLHTLDIQGRGWTKIPITIEKLERLRHLLLPEEYYGSFQIKTLTKLETLKNIKAENLIRNDGVLKLTNLRHLDIEFERSEEVEVFMKSPIVGSGRLRSLSMWNRSGDPFPNLELLSHCHRLYKLSLTGSIPEDVQCHHNLKFLQSNIAKLILHDSELKWDPMAVLEKLPNLRFLSLEFKSYIGSEMVCSAHGFPQLEFLQLQDLHEVEEWQVAVGAMPSLRSLSIRSLHKLRMIPEGLRFITTLQELTIGEMKRAFVKKLQVIDGVEGDDFYKVHHIPSISFRSPISFRNTRD